MSALHFIFHTSSLSNEAPCAVPTPAGDRHRYFRSIRLTLQSSRSLPLSLKSHPTIVVVVATTQMRKNASSRTLHPWVHCHQTAGGSWWPFFVLQQRIRQSVIRMFVWDRDLKGLNLARLDSRRRDWETPSHEYRYKTSHSGAWSDKTSKQGDPQIACFTSQSNINKKLQSNNQWNHLTINYVKYRISTCSTILLKYLQKYLNLACARIRV